MLSTTPQIMTAMFGSWEVMSLLGGCLRSRNASSVSSC